MKKGVVTFLLLSFLIVFSGCTENSQVEEDRTGQIGVLIQTTEVSYISPHDNEESTTEGEKGELVLILGENEDSYHVQFAMFGWPAQSGFVDKDFVSFDENDIQNATTGLVENVNVYEMPDENSTVTIEGHSSAIFIEGEDGDYFYCVFPGDQWGWIKKEDVQYIVTKSNWTIEMSEPDYSE